MGRPAKHSTDDFIDAAIEVFAEHGIRAVTLSAVAESIGAANGSIYHRFPTRPALLAAMWLRTSHRFETGYRQRLADPTIERTIAAAVWVVDWSAQHLPEAQVLQAGPRALGRAEWPPEALAQEPKPEDIRTMLRPAVKTLTSSTSASPDQIAFVMLELPIAVVRRKLQEGKPPGTRERELVRGIATLVLNQPAAGASDDSD